MIQEILADLEKKFKENDDKAQELFLKLISNKEMSLEDRIHYSMQHMKYSSRAGVLNENICLIKCVVENEKFWEEKKQDNCLKEETCIFGRGNLCDKCFYNKKNQEQTQPNLDEKDIMRKTILKQLKGVLNQSQADAIEALEYNLGDRGIKDKEIYQMFKYRLEGVICVINNTDYGSEKNRKIAETISKLYENKIL